ncbi:hypothetical protein OGAPHI_001671 [Ogataea philodendri]|uniref:Morphogenetic regulator of filamentous growth protein 1 n=1 Tax=Ogataea philodendri TaxID=1378263 RepID=A0A9P8PCD0_9ASCO|nr:uncharacterized protein OGAPHI_001671 [Ogataea philodendri]KAH3669075.1 hypothetical protein OGAPHI_001671 [Ogataea philodendri]
MNNGSANGNSPSRAPMSGQHGQAQQMPYINMGAPTQYQGNHYPPQIGHPAVTSMHSPMISNGSEGVQNPPSSHPVTPLDLPATPAGLAKPDPAADPKQGQPQWKNTNMATAAAASAMMGRPGVISQQQLAALQQLQATYGNLQNNIHRQLDEHRKSGQGVPVQAGNVKLQNMPPNNGQLSQFNFQNSNDIKKNIANIAIIRLFELTEKLCVRADSENLEYWSKVMEEYFSESAMATLALKHGSDGRFYTFTFSLFARILYAIALSGVGFFEISHNLIRANVLANGSTHLECSRLILRNWYLDGSYVTLYGLTKLQFSRQLKIEKIDISIYKTSAGLELGTIDKFLSKHDLIDSKSIRDNFAAFKGLSNFGFQENVMRVMQVGDVMTLVKPLMQFHAISGFSSPITSLEAFNKSTSTELSSLEKMSAQFHQAQLLAQRQAFKQNPQKQGFPSGSRPVSQTVSPSQQQKKKRDENGGFSKLDLANSTLNKRRKMAATPATNGTNGSNGTNGANGYASSGASSGGVSPKTVESDR